MGGDGLDSFARSAGRFAIRDADQADVVPAILSSTITNAAICAGS